MKLTKLKIDGYKNLDIDFQHNSDLLAIIGNNGSGKSNLLEAISFIFKSLYSGADAPSFDYEIEYINSKNEKIKIEKSKSKLLYFKDEEDQISIKDYLPKKVIAIYSGEEERLWKKCYQPVYDDFIKNINKTKQEGIVQGNMPQMLYLNKYYWNISLLALGLSDLEDNKKFIRETLGIDKIQKVKFDFDKSSYKNYSNSATLEFIQKLDKKNEYTIPQLKKLLEDEGYIPDDVYQHLYLAFTPKGSKIIKDITIKFNQHLTIEDLSEGEKKLLLLKAAFEFAEQEDSLFVLDEPDSHVHLNNKQLIVGIFDPYKNNRQIILTTHSPTVTSCIDDQSLRMVDKGRVIEKEKQQIIDDITGEFWNKQEQNVFITSKKPIILFVEGIHDKDHILRAYEHYSTEYKDIDFDIFQMNSACNIPPMMLGLRTSEVDYKKMFIGIFDNDETGRKECDNTKATFPASQNEKRHKEGYYAFKYPKHEGHSSGDLTVENLFSADKFESAYLRAVDEFKGRFTGKSIDSVTEKIKEKAKSILHTDSSGFSKEDFKYFKLVFEQIRLIKEDFEKQNSVEKKSNDTPKPETKTTLTKTKSAILYYKKDRVEAKGHYLSNGKFILLKGSEILKKYKSATKEDYKQEREKQLAKSGFTEDDWCYKIKSDIEFDSPSGAAKFVNGGSTNGWTIWKDTKGKTLSDLYRKK